MKQILLFILIFSSCNGAENTSEKQAINTPTEQPVADTSSKSQAKQAERERTGAFKNVENMTGSQIIDNNLNRLKSKLGLTDQQQTDIKAILTKTFLEMGEELNKTYTSDQFRIVGQNLIQKSFDQINALLDASQKEHFKRFGQH